MQEAPDPVDVSELQFKLKHKIRIFDNEDRTSFDKPCNLVVSASKQGLLFVATHKSQIYVVPLNAILETNDRQECRRYPYRVVDLFGCVSHLGINCDYTQLSVTVYKASSIDLLIYDLESFLLEDIKLVHNVNISCSKDTFLLDSGWNPTVPNIYSVCKSDGSLENFEFKRNGTIERPRLPVESESRCFCWSPKGKQIAVGSKNGNITQYKPDLSAVKIIAAPPAMGAPISLLWVSNYQFITINSSLSSSNNALIIVDAPKTGNAVYTNYDDICYSHEVIQKKQFYIQLFIEWDTLIVASSSSCEVGVLGIIKDRWNQFILPDSGRAELPLSTKSNQDTFPIGFTVDFTFKEISLPYLLLLSNEGLLTCYAIVNSKEHAKPLCFHQQPTSYNGSLFKCQDFDESHEKSVSAVTKSIEKELTYSSVSPVDIDTQYNDSLKKVKNTPSHLAKMIREDCCRLEGELNSILYKGCVQFFTGDDSVKVLDLENMTRTFVSEVTESLRIQNAEIRILKQSVIQAWAWYEDVQSRNTIYSNPTMTDLTRFQPLDSAGSRQLDDMQHLVYYLESQLINGHESLDGQWELFQMSCKETATLQLPSTEMVYQAMVKHNATLQKQSYNLKNIYTLIQSRLYKEAVPKLWMSSKRTMKHDFIFEKIKLDSQNSQSLAITKRFHLSAQRKSIHLKCIMNSHNVIYAPITKPNNVNAMINLSSLLSASSTVISSIQDTQIQRGDNVNWSLPSLLEDKNRYINLKRTHLSDERIINSAFAHTLSTRHRGTTDAVPQPEDKSFIKDTRSISFITNNEPPLNRCITSENSSLIRKDALNQTSKLFETCLKGDILQQTDMQFINESVSIPVKKLSNTSYIFQTDGVKINEKNTDELENKDESCDFSCNNSNKQCLNVPYSRANIMSSTMNNTLNSSSANEFIHIKGKHSLDENYDKQNYHGCTNLVSSDTFLNDIRNDIPATDNMNIGFVKMPPLLGTKEYTRIPPAYNTNPLPSMSTSNTIFEFTKCTDTNSSTTLTIQPSTLNTFTTPSSLTSLTTKTFESKASNLINIPSSVITSISTVPSNTFSISDSNTRANLYIKSLMTSGIMTSSSCDTPSYTIITPINSVDCKIVANKIDEFLENEEKVEATDIVGVSNMNSCLNTITNGTTQAVNPFNNNAFSLPLQSNLNTSIFGSISSASQNIFNNSASFHDNKLSKNNVDVSDAQKAALQFGSMKMGVDTIFGGTNPDTSLNKNPFNQTITTESMNVANSIFDNNSTTFCNFGGQKLQSSISTPFELNNSSFNTNPSSISAGLGTSHSHSFGESTGRSSGIFGSPPIFGSAPGLGISTFDSSNKVFGATESATGLISQQTSTFANLANQNAPMGFGNSAPNSSTSTITGGSSFSNWR